MSTSINLVQRRRAELQAAVGQLGQLVIAALSRSVTCLRGHDLSLAQAIIDEDAAINHQRRILEQECLVTLAAFKPAGADLRAIGACLELASELERIGDYAADIARILIKSGETPFPREPLEAVVRLGGEALAMLDETLEAFIGGHDEASARACVAREELVDHQEQALIDQILAMMRADPGFATLGTQLLWIAHNYERVADRATNVAERALYVASGEVADLG
ncbi:MAG: phosphate signaling complex protein PhoU [Sphingobacteriia bacterium]|nr:phosphate signaling complex protein PhoU [Sphingobacteriia bacterium]NCC38069.1 phosphate signaling complex protein PhoU [Gammaproteobacteria bacterium]